MSRCFFFILCNESIHFEWRRNFSAIAQFDNNDFKGVLSITRGNLSAWWQFVVNNSILCPDNCISTHRYHSWRYFGSSTAKHCICRDKSSRWSDSFPSDANEYFHVFKHPLFCLCSPDSNRKTAKYKYLSEHVIVFFYRTEGQWCFCKCTGSEISTAGEWSLPRCAHFYFAFNFQLRLHQHSRCSNRYLIANFCNSLPFV